MASAAPVLSGIVMLLAAVAAAAQTVPSTGGSVEVPSTGGSVEVPSTGGSVGVPSFGDVPVRAPARPAVVEAPANSARNEPRADAEPSRAWRAACAALAGPRPGLRYAYVSRSGALSQLWLNSDGSYSLQRSSAYSSYAEDGCYSIERAQIVFFKVASSALAETSAAPGGTRVILGSATDRQAFDRSAQPITLIAGGRGGLILDGDRYDVAR